MRNVFKQSFSSILVLFVELRKSNIRKSGMNQSQSLKERADKGMIELRIKEEMVKGGWTGEKGMDQIEVMEEEAVSM